ncbi:hypothetical protein Lal_00027018 [Lupinus albus]|nr:hypothetical protein Lal_00027018 [Lupinus albus]
MRLLCLSQTQRRCLADVCGALHCDHEINSGSKKSKCNPAAAAKNKHMCESLADSCFPINEGPAASRLHGNSSCGNSVMHTAALEVGNLSPEGAGFFMCTEEDKCVLPFRVNFASDAASTLLSLHLPISERNENGNSSAEAYFASKPKEKAILIDRSSFSSEVLNLHFHVEMSNGYRKNCT